MRRATSSSDRWAATAFSSPSTGSGAGSEPESGWGSEWEWGVRETSAGDGVPSPGGEPRSVPVSGGNEVTAGSGPGCAERVIMLGSL